MSARLPTSIYTGPPLKPTKCVLCGQNYVRLTNEQAFRCGCGTRSRDDVEAEIALRSR
jgi:hypothetical protein